MSIEIEDIKKVNLSKDDMVVLRFSQTLSSEQRDSIEKLTKARFPHNKVICLDGGASIDIVTPRADTINSTINIKGVSHDELICVNSIIDAVKGM